MENKNQPNLELIRHSTAHVMAAAVCRIYKDVKLDIGPSIDTGFYYDFDLSERISPEDFPAIEKQMIHIIEEDLPFQRIEVPRDEAIDILKQAGQTYKLNRLKDIPDEATISFYRCGDFIDLCRGPHLESTGRIKAFTLLSVAGSYFRGLETNPMLQRLYGTAAISRKNLDYQLKQLEESRKRDHRKLGKELDLFSIQEDTGPGLVFWHPKAARIRTIIEDFWRKEHFKHGYDIVYTPHIGRANLWETSGHLDFYRENMYSPMDIEGKDYFVRPMNCPFHIQVYKSDKRSYRDLPLRWAELGTVYRYEKSGVLHGLFRVRGFTQDDAHIFCTPGQIESEIRRTVKFALNIWKTFGFSDIKAYLSTRPEKAVGEDSKWEQATASLENALIAESIPYEVEKGGGAFYGPKIDLAVKDAIGREWQMSTVQFDFNMPTRFKMGYIGEDGKEAQPYMVHRALLGSLERFLGILIEHYAGAFPLWLAPEQVRVLPIADAQIEHADNIAEQLRANGFRTSVDRKSGKIGAKIRNAQIEKIPYMVIIGAKEIESEQLSIRSRTKGDIGAMNALDFITTLRLEEEERGKK